MADGDVIDDSDITAGDFLLLKYSKKRKNLYPLSYSEREVNEGRKYF